MTTGTGFSLLTALYCIKSKVKARQPRDTYNSRGAKPDGILRQDSRRLRRQAAKEADLQRNDPCWCGSGKKYKKCHYEGDRKRGAGKAKARKPS